jgi:hypothetical protein
MDGVNPTDANCLGEAVASTSFELLLFDEFDFALITPEKLGIPTTARRV